MDAFLSSSFFCCEAYQNQYILVLFLRNSRKRMGSLRTYFHSLRYAPLWELSLRRLHFQCRKSQRSLHNWVAFSSFPLISRSKKWFPHSPSEADTRWVYLKVEGHRRKELEISDAHHVPQPILIPHKNKLDRLDSPVDVVFYEYGSEGKFERFTANKRKIQYPEREL